MSYQLKTIKEFAELCYDLLKADNGINIGVGGDTGKGKSCFLTQVMKCYGDISHNKWGYELMTWSRKELMEWIDGKDKKKEPGPDGLREGQLAEYSALIADELYAMFCAKNWFTEDQIDGVATFNSCRDRHLLIGGAVPNFWQLDGSFTDRIHFYVFIPWRGIAWVFQKENNPFTKNQWNPDENKKIFRKYKNPYRCPNFLCEIHFDDWEPDERIAYYEIRNKKRMHMTTDIVRRERYANVKLQRDKLISMVYTMNPSMELKTVAELIDMSIEGVRLIKEGLR